METLKRGVFHRHDGCAIRTVEGTMFRNRCPSEDTWKTMKTLRTTVSDNHDGSAGHTIVLMTVCHMFPLKDTYKK